MQLHVRSFLQELVKDITNEKYNAILHVNWGIDPFEQIQKNYQQGFDTLNVKRLIEIIEEETRASNIRGYTGNRIKAAIPNIHFLQQLPFSDQMRFLVQIILYNKKSE